MKNRTYRNILGFFLASVVLIASCKKEDPVKLDAQFATWEVNNITSTTADLSGFVVAEGGGYTGHGVCWNTTGEPTISDATALADTIDAAVFIAEATGLEHLTKYFARAYVKAADGTLIYGEDVSFTTLAHVPTVSVVAITAVTSNSAESGGGISYDGKAEVKGKGVCWSMEENPVIEVEDDDITAGLSKDGKGMDDFVSNIGGLIGGTKYYVRAYARNKAGTGYSDQLTFTTDIGVPYVTSDSVKDVGLSTAKIYGHAMFTGGAAITERGFYWGTSENPTAADNTIITGTADTAKFSADLTGLAVSTTYHVRAYAINSEGTAYGDNLKFATPPNQVFITGPAVGGWNQPGEFEMTKLSTGLFEITMEFTASSEFKFFAQADWGPTGYGWDTFKDGEVSALVKEGGGGNLLYIGPTKEFKMTVDFINKTITMEQAK